MTQQKFISKIICSRESNFTKDTPVSVHKNEAEGGCGVIGIACSEKIAARHLLQALIQMRNRGNGKGGGLAAVGLVPSELGVSQEVLDRDYLINIAYLETGCRAEVEKKYINPVFETDHVRRTPTIQDYKTIAGLEVQPPEVYQYFVRPKSSVINEFKRKNGFDSFTSHPLSGIEDEFVYQNSYLLNQEFYSSTGRIRSFVLSHGKNMIVYKMVGYADDVVRYYQLEDLHANVWIGHHRYPTKGTVWHPGGAHPFVGLHEALVHNGDFANYTSICEYLKQRNIQPLFLTDTEVSVLVFDLLHRTYGYPLEYVIEALAPTTERDFSLLPEEKQRVYRMLQQVHMHGSPDGPWFFLIAQSHPAANVFRLIGITDTSMLRPQVFALQEGEVSIGFAASEKQAIDAALESLASCDPRFWTHADRYWNARGGSHTDGGAFVFTVKPNGSKATLLCNDKFGRLIKADTGKNPYPTELNTVISHSAHNPVDLSSFTASGLFTEISMKISNWTYEDVMSFLDEMESAIRRGQGVRDAIRTLTLLIDRRYPTGTLRRSSLLSLFDQRLSLFFELLQQQPSSGYIFPDGEAQGNTPINKDYIAVLNARLFSPEGDRSVAMEIVRLYRQGFRRFVVLHARGHRFIANGLGVNSHGVTIDVYGSSGDYLASGLDGAEVIVHGNAQDQLAQVMKDGKLIVYGDVGQTFMYAAKGGQAFVLGNAAGRPMINAVGKPRVIINGTCLDYLAESFMAGDPLDGGGFVILNGISLEDNGKIIDLDTPYPGSNLFSLASGGAIYIRDPWMKVSAEQLNGGDFVEFTDADWALIRPYLEENQRLFGISLARLLETGEKTAAPAEVYRKIRPLKIQALLAGHSTGE